MVHCSGFSFARLEPYNHKNNKSSESYDKNIGAENMMKENIHEIRIEWIAKIKEKVRKNPKYIHPCNKERLEDMEILQFSNGYDFTCWMQQNGILNSPARTRDKYFQGKGFKDRREYEDKCSRDSGFKDSSERRKEWTHDTGRNLPKELNKDCPAWFGDFICENYVMKTFEDPVKMVYGNPGYDWLCKRGEKIDHKGSCLMELNSNKTIGWQFHIRYNNIADYFTLSAWDNRDSLIPLHVWVFHKNDIVRGRKFCKFENFGITNSPKTLKELEKWEVTDRLDKLREICNRIKDNKHKIQY